MEHIRVSDKIRLERIKISMAEEIFNTINRDRKYLREWLPFVDSTLEVSHTETFIRNITEPSNKRDEVYTIWYNETFAGLIAIKDSDYVNRKTEIGYWLAEKMQHKGIITSSVKKLTEFAFNRLKMNRVQIKVAENNFKSEAVPKRLHFQYEGIERAGERHQDKYLNLKVYSLLATDRY